jgi:hypothetical protein
MKTLTIQEQQQLNDNLSKIKILLMDYPGVINVGIGLAIKENVITNEPAIIVAVNKKRKSNELVNNELIPKQINGIRIDIIETNPIDQGDPYGKFDKLIGGISISNSRLRGLGTLGGIFYDKKTNKPVGITNWHVAKRLRGRVGDRIVQPGGANANDNTIGTLTDWDKSYDCARIDLTARAIEIYSKQNHVKEDLKGLGIPMVGMPIRKSGARTGLTYAVIQSIFGTDINIVPNPQKTPKDTEISMSGDSGSLWTSDDGSDLRAIALHWGGDLNSYMAYAIDINKVADLLNIKL